MTDREKAMLDEEFAEEIKKLPPDAIITLAKDLKSFQWRSPEGCRGGSIRKKEERGPGISLACVPVGPAGAGLF